MRWERLFDDLESLWEEREREDARAEVADRTRRELASVALLSRLAASEGDLEFLLVGGRRYAGAPVDLGADFVVIADGTLRRLLNAAAIVQVSGLGRRVGGPRDSVALRRFGLGYALRAIARDRAPVLVDDVLGRSLTGTIDGVGADHLDFAEHPLDQPRRASAVQAARVLTYAGLVAVTAT